MMLLSIAACDSKVSTCTGINRTGGSVLTWIGEDDRCIGFESPSQRRLCYNGAFIMLLCSTELSWAYTLGAQRYLYRCVERYIQVSQLICNVVLTLVVPDAAYLPAATAFSSSFS